MQFLHRKCAVLDASVIKPVDANLAIFENKNAHHDMLVSGDGKLTADPAHASWRWTIFSMADARARRTIETNADLNDVVRETLLSTEKRHYLTFDSGWLHGCLPDLIHENYSPTEMMGHLRFAMSESRLLMGRKSPLQSLERVRSDFESGKVKIQRPVDVLFLLVVQLGSVMRLRIGSAESVLDSIEMRILNEDWSQERERLGELRRTLAELNRHGGTISRIFRHVLQSEDGDLPEYMSDRFQDILQRTSAMQGDIEQVQIRARLLQDEIMARLSERSNQLLGIISVMTAVMLPATIVTGLFGMNTDGIPFSGSSFGFWLAAATALIFAVIFYVFVRRLNRK